MTDHPEQEITTQILIQMRDEMRSMRSQFRQGVDGLTAHMKDFEKRLDSLESHMGSLERHMDSVVSHIDSLESRMASLKLGLDAREPKNEAHLQRIHGGLERIDGDLKKFAALVNDTVLHYADEMDSVRERLDSLEREVGFLTPSE